jgi:hypothetical protein
MRTAFVRLLSNMTHDAGGLSVHLWLVSVGSLWAIGLIPPSAMVADFARVWMQRGILLCPWIAQRALPKIGSAVQQQMMEPTALERAHD